MDYPRKRTIRINSKAAALGLYVWANQHDPETAVDLLPDLTDLDTPIEELDLTVRAYNALKKHGVNKLAELIDYTERILIEDVRNLGRGGVDVVIRQLWKKFKLLLKGSPPPATTD